MPDHPNATRNEVREKVNDMLAMLGRFEAHVIETTEQQIAAIRCGDSEHADCCARWLRDDLPRLRGSGGFDRMTDHPPTESTPPGSDRCYCCDKAAPKRNPDPWEGRLDGYCEVCATTRCDAYPGSCREPAPEPTGQEELEERLLDSGTCSCVWDANPEEGGPDDVIVRPDPNCLAHTILNRLTATEEKLAEAIKERDEARTRMWSIEDEVIRPYNAELEARCSSLEAALGELIHAADDVGTAAPLNPETIRPGVHFLLLKALRNAANEARSLLPAPTNQEET